VQPELAQASLPQCFLVALAKALAVLKAPEGAGEDESSSLVQCSRSARAAIAWATSVTSGTERTLPLLGVEIPPCSVDLLA